MNGQVIELTENCNENSQSTHTHCYQRGIAVVPTVTVSVYYAVQKKSKTEVFDKCFITIGKQNLNFIFEYDTC